MIVHKLFKNNLFQLILVNKASEKNLRISECFSRKLEKLSLSKW